MKVVWEEYSNPVFDAIYNVLSLLNFNDKAIKIKTQILEEYISEIAKNHYFVVFVEKIDDDLSLEIKIREEIECSFHSLKRSEKLCHDLYDISDEDKRYYQDWIKERLRKISTSPPAILTRRD